MLVFDSMNNRHVLAVAVAAFPGEHGEVVPPLLYGDDETLASGGLDVDQLAEKLRIAEPAPQTEVVYQHSIPAGVLGILHYQV